ncbi:MAG: LCP family protein [Leptolyngbyaceae bacterium]|nr:LCP family protein [Leptolyngbyaceae bacterium]
MVVTATPQRFSIVRWLFWSFAFVVTTAASATVGATLTLLTPLPPTLAPWERGQRSPDDIWSSGFLYRVTRPVNVLVMGIDRVPGVSDTSPNVFAGRSDTMLLLHIHPATHSVSLLSIPRDTQVEIPDIGTDKINDANVKGGPALAARVVSRTLNNLPIDRYVRVSTSAFRELVDLLGGLDVFVPRPMSYVDHTQKLKIDLAQGWQTLNGDQAEQFARFRQDELGDIGRVQRQQALLKALQERLISPAALPRVPQMVRITRHYLDTNLTPEEVLSLLSFALKLEQGKLKMVMLPGRFSTPDESVASYWILDPEGRDHVLRDYFNFGQPAIAVQSSPSLAATHRLRIAIQNASGQPHIGSQMAEYLKQQGFQDLYLVEDWTDQQRQTQIIAQQGNLAGATAIQKILGLGEVEASSIGDLESDLTIRVGQDWSNSKFK